MAYSGHDIYVKLQANYTRDLLILRVESVCCFGVYETTPCSVKNRSQCGISRHVSLNDKPHAIYRLRFRWRIMRHRNLWILWMGPRAGFV